MKIVIVEDSDLVRDQLVRIIGTQSRLQVVCLCAEAVEAVQVILDRQPDTVLLDLSLSPGSGLSVLRRIRAAGCGSRVLVLTNNAESALREACEAMGVSGFLDKSSQAEDCLQRLFSWLPPLPENDTTRLCARPCPGTFSLYALGANCTSEFNTG